MKSAKLKCHQKCLNSWVVKLKCREIKFLLQNCKIDQVFIKKPLNFNKLYTWKIFFYRHCEIKMPRNIVFWMNRENFLALKNFLFYFVYLIGLNNVGQKQQKFCPMEILPCFVIFFKNLHVALELLYSA